MSDAYVFGDIEADDVYTVGVLVDPDHVAYRMHELRAYVDGLAGTNDTPTWGDLSEPEQQLALAIGDVIVRWLIDVDPDEPEQAARNLHEVRRYWASSRLPPWDDVPPADRQIGIDLMGAIITWLRREGTLPVRGNLP